MKRFLLLTAVYLLAATPAFAVPSLGSWDRNDPRATYQKWDFSPGYIRWVSEFGLTADPEAASNPFPDEVAATVTAESRDEVGTIHSQQSIFVSLEVPNFSGGAHKILWVDIAASAPPTGMAISALPGRSTEFRYDLLAAQSGADHAALNGMADFGWRITPNPRVEKLQFIIPANERGAWIDAIVVDTMCTPAPGAIMLCGLGVYMIGWLRCRRMF